ncbi:hypothetical protein [Microbacterium paludicola]|uniref:hypothetical protein n=1 Tax=Microbacterium paludicola TaxID=300019 RepID=UPI00119EB488|nr:hypothetical protein [Microbacterium paludicola]
MQSTSQVKVEIAGVTMYGDRTTGWGIIDLLDWGDGADSRGDEDLIPGVDGLFPPDAPLVNGLRFTVVGEYVTTSPQQATAGRDWLRSLSKLDPLPVRVLEGARWDALRFARVDGRVHTEIDHALGGRRVSFEIPIRTADPRKYGPLRPIEIDAVAQTSGGLRFPIVEGALDFATEGLTAFPGVFKIENPGTAEFYPERFAIRGPLAGFTITSEQATVEYDGSLGSGDVLVLTPYAGGRATLNGADVSHNLIRADWVAVQPGETRGYLFTPSDPQPGAKLTVEYPEGAWW